MKSNSIYDSIPVAPVKKAKFDLSHEFKLTGNMGYLIPILCEEVLPGESWRWQGNLLARLAPMLAPVMHLMHATMHCYHIPNRILTTAWKNFITGGENGQSSDTPPSVAMHTLLQSGQPLGSPAFTLRFGEGSLWDYMGLPPVAYNANPALYVDTTTITLLPFLAYQCIWQNFYKDQNIDTDTVMQQPIGGGSISPTPILNDYLTLRKRAWQKDPFTSVLPWPQRGADVLLPVSGPGVVSYLSISKVKDSAGTLINTAGSLVTQASATGDLRAGSGAVQARVENISSVTFSNTSITINDFRTAVVLQQYLEMRARGGSRYNETILSEFDTKVPDFRLDMPEYIGGNKQRIQVSEVLTTAFSESAPAVVVPPGNMAGHGISVGGGNSFVYKTTEHGWMMVILSVLPDTAYQQGIPKKFTRTLRTHYGSPLFAGLGEQPVLSKELYYNPLDTSAVNDTLFGYQQRFWEYKSASSRTSGAFRTTLAQWTLTRIFAARPTYNTSFVYMDETDARRIFAVNDASHKIWMQVVHDISVLRPFPYYSVPGLMKI